MAKSNGKASYGVNKSLATSPPKQPTGVGNENEQRRKRVKTKGELKEELQSDPTHDYHYTRYNYFGELFVQNLPLWRLFTGRMMLTSDPVVSFSMNIRNAALMAAEVVVSAKNPEVGKWVQKQWDYLWNYHRLAMVSSKELGFSPLQVQWKEDEKGILNICGLKEFAPEDCRGKEKGGKLVGMAVKGEPLFFPHGLWLNHNPKYGGSYGNPITRRQYPAWYEKWMERGAKRLQQLRMIKDAYIGDIFWYPPDMLLEIPDGDGGVKKIPWRDVLREIAESRVSGGAMTLPLKLDSNGKELTRYQPPTPIPGATEIFNWVEYCDDNILRGADIPSEVVQAADTGSGFSGRSIPFLVLLSVCNGELSEGVQQTDERSLRPVAALNFGGDPDYTIEPKSLVETFSADISGSSLAGSSIGGGPQQGGQQGTPQAVAQQYSERDSIWSARGGVAEKHGWTRLNKHTYEHQQRHPDPKSLGQFLLRFHKNGLWTHGTGGSIAKGRGHEELDTHLTKFHSSQYSEETKEEAHEFSCLLFNLPGQVSFEVRQLGEMIPHEDLAEDGRELNPHITLKFGLHTDDTEEVRTAIQHLPPIAIQIGKASIFQSKDEEGKPNYDVVKLEVESEGLHNLNKAVSDTLECTDTHPEYKPHITIAYVKPGLGEFYARKLNSLEGDTVSFHKVIFSNKRREWHPIRLLGKAQFSEVEYSQHAERDIAEGPKGAKRLLKTHGFTHIKIKALFRNHYHHPSDHEIHFWKKHDSDSEHSWTLKHPNNTSTQGVGLSELEEHLKKLHSQHQEGEHSLPFAQAKDDSGLFRWHVHTHKGRKTTWAKTAKEAEDKASKNGFKVHKVEPAPSMLHDKPSQHDEFLPYCDWFDEEQFAEGSYLQRLRDLIGKGLDTARGRIKGLGSYIRTLNVTNSLQSLSDLIEEQIRKLNPFLGNDLFSDAFPSYVGGTLDVVSRLPVPEQPLEIKPSPERPSERSELPPLGAIAPETTLEAGLEAATLAVQQPPALPQRSPSPPVAPSLAEILFPEPHDPEVHLPAIEAAVEALNQSPVAVGAHYLETAKKVKQGSFAITGELTEKAVADIRDVLAKNIEEGKPQAEFIETVAKRLEEEGSPLSPARLENVFRTNTMAAYSKAQFEAVQHPLVSDAFPYVRRSATKDARVRPEHWAMEAEHGLNGTAFYRADDPVFHEFRAPWSYNCRCRDTYQSVKQAADAGVEEAKAWLGRAQEIAKTQGGSFYQYLARVAPVQGEHVQHPPFSPDPAFKRDLVVGS